MSFLKLPRELRDMVYTELLVPAERLPDYRDTLSASNWCLISQPHQTASDSRCFMSSREMPSTCASMLASNRQIREEMMQTAGRAREKGQLASRMDCLVHNNAHYFTWLAVPFVRPTMGRPWEQQQQQVRKQSWMSMITDSLSWLASVFSMGADGTKGGFGSILFSRSYKPTYATIERLWVDIRPFESAAPSVAESRTLLLRSDETCWAICAALKHMFDHGPDPTRRHRRLDCVDEVVLNIRTRPDAASSTASGHESDDDTLFVPESHEKATKLLRNELVDVWDKIWSATDDDDDGDVRAMLYRTLLWRIRRVRICVDGVTFRTRGLAVELERGRAEMRRIRMR